MLRHLLQRLTKLLDLILSLQVGWHVTQEEDCHTACYFMTPTGNATTPLLWLKRCLPLSLPSSSSSYWISMGAEGMAQGGSKRVVSSSTRLLTTPFIWMLSEICLWNHHSSSFEILSCNMWECMQLAKGAGIVPTFVPMRNTKNKRGWMLTFLGVKE